MTEQPHTPETIPTSRRLRAIPKLLGTVALLFVLWFLLTQVAPRFIFPTSDVPSETSNIPHNVLEKKEAQISALSNRIEQLEARLKTFEEVITASQGGSGVTDEKITALQNKITLLESSALQINEQGNGEIKTALSGQQQDIASLKADMDKIRADNSARIAAMTAFTNLQDALIKGQPFAHHLKLLEELLATRADAKDMLSALAPHASKGVMTESDLLAHFDKTVDSALSPNTKPDSILANLKTLVRVRKVGTPEGTDDEAIIARTETALKAGQFEDALQSLRELSPQAASAFAAWGQSAGQFINARKVLESLNVLVMQPAPIQTQAVPAAIAEQEKPTDPAPAVDAPAKESVEEEAMTPETAPLLPADTVAEPADETEETP